MPTLSPRAASRPQPAGQATWETSPGPQPMMEVKPLLSQSVLQRETTVREGTLGVQ